MRHEVRRGRKFIEYHDPETQPEGTFTQEISGADVSYQDEGGSWQQLVEDWETDGADGFSFRASRMNHKVRFDSIGAWRWYPRRNVETEYLVLNRPQCWLTATKRWGNLLVNGISREGKDITLTSLRNVTRVIHSRWNGIKTDWILENANAPTRFRQKIDLVGITEIAGVLFGADGERLGQLTPTTATDANGVELPCSGSYSGGYVEFSADVSGAAYPVTIDPDFGSGDGGDTWIVSPDPTLNYGESGGCHTYGVKLLHRFILSSINSSATCTAVALKLTASATKDVSVTFYKITDANGDWIAGTKKAQTAGAGEPCWNAKAANGSGGVTTAWAGSVGMSTAGTDYVNTALGTMTCYDVDANNTQYTATFNASGIAVVQDWFGDATNNGFIGIPSAPQISHAFASSENTTESYRPVLTVTYTAASSAFVSILDNQQSVILGGSIVR